MTTQAREVFQALLSDKLSFWLKNGCSMTIADDEIEIKCEGIMYGRVLVNIVGLVDEFDLSFFVTCEMARIVVNIY